jgi:hypothetical protein
MVKCYLSLRLDIALIFATMPRLNIPETIDGVGTIGSRTQSAFTGITGLIV